MAMQRQSAAPVTRLLKIKEFIFRPSVLSVFILVGLWNISVSSGIVTRYLEGPGAIRETLSEIRDVNLHAQLRLYNWLTQGRPIKMNNQNVTLVAIDDVMHWDLLHGSLPTNRSFIASLIEKLSADGTNASVIGLDIELLGPRDLPDGSPDPPREAENAALLNAIRNATQRNIPVVLGGAYIPDKNGSKKRLPLLFSNAQLQSGGGIPRNGTTFPEYGYLNGPDDKRVIPVAKEVVKIDGGRTKMDSLASAITKADPRGTNIEDPGLFGSFLSGFNTVTALQIMSDDKVALSQCAGKIVIIGGDWRDLQSYGGWTDRHLSPAGIISGMAFHANYVESLLQSQYAHEVGLTWAIAIDLVIGLLIYGAFALWGGWKGFLILLVGFVAPD
jgi:CHASE2 domain-containing sensor protein